MRFCFTMQTTIQWQCLSLAVLLDHMFCGVLKVRRMITSVQAHVSFM
ncbi:unnamed protein product [Cylicostephanus goldi]|uniref:Uncharacterized protein n=1 Tax=Cylicostephanus goldi TaxID=71465 RepID=A0A3P7QYY6_CYLGO|nr:unnamed protein product [Cylicostephanus goldi]